NSVLGARTERYGDFLDICAALSARAPETGLHLDDNRRATLAVDCSALADRLVDEEAFWPVLGAWLGSTAGGQVAVFSGLGGAIDDDRLKAMGAAAASAGAVGLYHIDRVTPEDPRLVPGHDSIRLTGDMLHDVRDRLSTTTVTAGKEVDAVAVGSPHFSLEEF